MRQAKLVPIIVLILWLCPNDIMAQADPDYSVLIVTAHPDDDAMFAGTVYRISHHLGGAVDLALITDGAGGYRYSTLGEAVYGINLTDSATAAKYLPAIRKKELMAGGDVVGIRNYFFLDQPDAGYTLDPEPFLSGTVWDSQFVRDRLSEIIRNNNYDFIFALLPRAETHGHHKAATIFAVQAVATLGEEKPVVLGAWISSKEADAEPIAFSMLDGYPETRTPADSSNFQFDRTAAFGLNGRLNYKIVSNWVIAEHKSQGTMQLLVNRGDVEEYWVLGAWTEDGLDRADELFRKLSTPWITND